MAVVHRDVKPSKCHCSRSGGEKHAAGCRPARPLCRWMRKRRANRRPCACSAYHFKHRSGGGACRDGIPNAIRNSKSWKEIHAA